MTANTFNRQKRQFRNLAQKVNQLILNGDWVNLTAASRNRILVKLNTLYRQLSSYLTKAELKKILASAAILIGLPLVSQSQSFAPPQLNPFGLVSDSVTLASPKFADIDHDGDFDLFAGKYGGAMQFFENTGTTTTPHFAEPQLNPFGIVGLPGEFNIAFPAFADIDDDGDLDLFIGGISGDVRAYDADILFYENTGTNIAPAFAAPQANPFGLGTSYIFAMPEFADIDNDGDLDLLVGEGYGNWQYYENTGTKEDAAFSAPLQNPFGLTQLYSFGSPAFADIDHDGDLDLFAGEYYGDIHYFQNTGTVESPSFAPSVENPFGLAPTVYYNFPAIADLDDDGDLDIMVGEYYSNMQYFRNTEFNVGLHENQGEASFELYPNPAKDDVFISLKDENFSRSAQVSIIDLNGKIVKSSMMQSKDIRLTTNDLPPGIYVVRIVRGDEVSNKKLIVR